MNIETPNFEWTRASDANLTNTSFPSRIATTTAPTGNAVISWKRRTEGGQNIGANTLQFKIIGTGADNATLQVRLWGWRSLELSGSTTIYSPTLLLELDAVLSTSVGVAGSALLSTERVADAITATSGFTAPDWCTLHSRTDDLDGHVLCDGLGFPLLEWTFDLGTATAGNILYSRM